MTLKWFILPLLLLILLVALDVRWDAKKPSHQTCSAGRKLAPIMDQQFNIREATKNMILLEDHLFHDDRRCVDCVRKHCLTIEAYLDEAFGLDKRNAYTDNLNGVARDYKSVSNAILSSCEKGLPSQDCAHLGQRLRTLRKKMMPMCTQ